MTLKMTTKTFHAVDCYDLDELIRDTYGVPHAQYSFVAVEECGNDSSHEFYVTPEEDDEVAEWAASGGKTWISNDQILNDLCLKGLIPAGTYLVSVCW